MFTARMVYFFRPPPYYNAASHFAREVVKSKIAGKSSNEVNHIISFVEIPYHISQ